MFADIARLRRGPEDLPSSASLLLLTTVAYAVLDALLLSIAPGLPGNPALLIGIDIGVTLAWYAMLLRIAQKPERYLQTVTAVLGFQLVLAPLLNPNTSALVILRCWSSPATSSASCSKLDG